MIDSSSSVIYSHPRWLTTLGVFIPDDWRRYLSSFQMVDTVKLVILIPDDWQRQLFSFQMIDDNIHLHSIWLTDNFYHHSRWLTTLGYSFLLTSSSQMIPCQDLYALKSFDVNMANYELLWQSLCHRVVGCVCIGPGQLSKEKFPKNTL